MRDILLVLVLILIAVLGEILVKHIEALWTKTIRAIPPRIRKKIMFMSGFQMGRIPQRYRRRLISFGRQICSVPLLCAGILMRI